MKFSKLLVLGALSLFGLGAQAADLIERTAPEAPNPTIDLESLDKTPSTFVVGNYYVLFNKGAQQYFTEGNAWGTQASLGDTPNLSRFTLPEGKTLEEGILLFNDFSTAKNSWKLVFFDSATAMFVDRGGQANYFWQVVEGGEPNTYRLQASDANPELNPTNNPGFVGVAADAAQGAALSPFLSEGWIDWEFYTVPEWNVYGVAKDIYDKSQELKLTIEAAEEEGVDITAAVAVYNNEESTYDQIVAAIAALQEARKNNAANGTVDNPSDATSFIVNPSYVDNSKDGWTVVFPDPDHANNKNHAVNYHVAECFNNNFYYYQDLNSILNGVYELKVDAFYRAGDAGPSYNSWTKGTDKNLKLYAKTGEDSVTVAVLNIFDGATDEALGIGTSANAGEPPLYVPNNMEGAEAYFKEGHYPNSLFFSTDDNTARIGIAKSVNINNNWSIWGNWKLKYYGNTPEAFTFWAKEAANAMFNPNLLEGAIYTQSYVDAFNSLVANANATNKAEVLAFLPTAEEAVAALVKNISLYKELQEIMEEAEKLYSGAFDDYYIGELSDWVDFDLKPILKNHNLTNEELEEAIATGRKLIKDVTDRPTGNSDVTSYLTNPAFSSNDWTGWTKEAADGGNVRVDQKCAEAWNNSSFDIYQTYEGAPVGVYEISVQGFYRYGRGDDAWNRYQSGTEEFVKPNGAPVFVYLNAKKTPFKNVYDEPGQTEEFYDGVTGDCQTAGDDLLYPNGMQSAAVAFNAGMYTQTAYGLVKEGDPLRIGVKGSSNQLGDSWVIFDNFKLTYKGYDAQAIGEVLAEELEKAAELLKSDMGKTAYASLSKAIADANAAIQANDGKAMFNALNSLFEAEDEVNASIKKFADLAAAMENFNQEIEASNNSTAKTDASILYETIQTKLGNHEIDESELDGIYEQINNMITKLRMPDYASAADTNPIDFTNIITNASYNENADGWTTEAKVGYSSDGANAEIFGQAYDYYQEFSGLPAGTYRVAVQAFYRAGGAKEDYADFIGENVNNNAYLYAEGASPVSQAVSRLSSYVMEVQQTEGYTDDNPNGPSSWTVAEDQDLGDDMHNYLLVCNNMSNAANLLPEYYGGDPVVGTGNVVTVKVGDDGKLRLGLKKLKEMDNDWTIFDEWQLWYFGANSQLTISGDPYTEGIEEVLDLNDVVKSEYFTIDGLKATAVQKGIIIQKMTLANGAVVVKKIRK